MRLHGTQVTPKRSPQQEELEDSCSGPAPSSVEEQVLGEGLSIGGALMGVSKVSGLIPAAPMAVTPEQYLLCPFSFSAVKGGCKPRPVRSESSMRLCGLPGAVSTKAVRAPQGVLLGQESELL